MKLTRLEIDGFRGLYRTFDLQGDTILTAGNGKGKTTFLCALLWLLCGVDDEDKSNYNLFDNRLPADDPDAPLRASVEAEFDTITVSRSVAQKWVRNKEGERVRKGDEYTYAINGMEVNATRFNQLIEENFMPIAQLKFALNIRRWEMLDPMALRKAICTLTDEAKPADSKYDVIGWALESGVDSAKKHFSQRQREWESTSQKLAIELAAAKSRMPEVEDAESLQATLDAALNELKEIDSRITVQIPADILQKRQDEERAIYEKKAQFLSVQNEYAIDMQQKVAQAKADLDDAKAVRKRNADRRERMREAMKQLELAENDRKALLEELSENSAQKFTGLCPTCGQELKGDNRTEQLKLWKAQNKETETRIIERGKKAKARIEAYHAQIDELQAQILADNEKDVIGLERVYEFAKANAAVVFAETDEAKAMVEEIAKLESARTPMPDMQVSEADKVRKGELLVQVENLRNRIAVAKHNAAEAEKLQEEIDRLAEKRTQALRKLGESTLSLNLAREYETECAKMVQDDINGYFKKIRIRLSDVSKTGDVVDCCKVEMASVADTLNTASRVVAGIEISLAFQRKYGVSLPMVIDNSESIERTRIDADGRQVVLMYMREGEELQINKI